jgi:hypothetical protein
VLEAHDEIACRLLRTCLSHTSMIPQNFLSLPCRSAGSLRGLTDSPVSQQPNGPFFSSAFHCLLVSANLTSTKPYHNIYTSARGASPESRSPTLTWRHDYERHSFSRPPILRHLMRHDYQKAMTDYREHDESNNARCLLCGRGPDAGTSFVKSA